MQAKHETVKEYIEQFPDSTKGILNNIRQTIFSAVPDAVETISYGMPAYKYRNKVLVYFAGYKNHIGFYATPNGHSKFKSELSGYKQGKGSVQFPIHEPIPYDLIRRIVMFRSENLNPKTG